MALVQPLAADADKEVARLAKFFNETLGFCPNSVLTMQHRPAIGQAFINLNKAVMENQAGVTSELKRLIGYISSRVAGCQYCQAHTIRAAQRYGGSDERLEAIINEWVKKGWQLDEIKFAMKDSSKRPAMAFILFVKEEERNEE